MFVFFLTQHGLNELGGEINIADTLVKCGLADSTELSKRLSGAYRPDCAFTSTKHLSPLTTSPNSSTSPQSSGHTADAFRPMVSLGHSGVSAAPGCVQDAVCNLTSKNFTVDEDVGTQPSCVESLHRGLCKEISGDDRKTVSESQGETLPPSQPGVCGGEGFVSFEAFTVIVTSPGDFYVHKFTTETGENLMHVANNLGLLVEEMTGVHDVKFCIGDLCCVSFSDDVYYRGLVVDINLSCASSNEDDVQVFFIDYGDKKWFVASKILPLPKQFYRLKPQAIWCQLAHLSSHLPSTWPPESLMELRRLTDGKILHIICLHATEIADRYSVMLILCSAFIVVSCSF